MKKGRIKQNPLIKDQKRIKSLNIGSDDEGIIKKFIIIVAVIVLLIGIVYAITELTKKKEEDDSVVSGEINYDVLSIGMLFNRPEKEYYVLLYNEDDTNAVLYSGLMTSYKNKKEHKIYFCNLANKLNSDYYNVGKDNKSNPKATSISELDLGDLTLIKVKDKKIVKYLEDYEKIKAELK